MSHARATRLTGFALLACSILMACAQAPQTARTQSSVIEPVRSAPKRVTAAIMAEPAALHRAFIAPGHVIQAGDVADFVVNLGLTVVDSDGVRRPALAETVPTVENGLWKVLPDGQMEFIWRIRPGATWHDGTPMSADDLVFTATVVQDREFPEFRAAPMDMVDRVEAVDARTILAVWKRPFIRADRLFTTGSDGMATPLPRHVLERQYLEAKDGFRQLPYWSSEYVGLGPYKLKEWNIGSHLLLEANEAFALGRPKIDELEVRFVLDANTLAANVLSGVVQASLGTGLSLEQSIEVRDQWREGRIEIAYEHWILIYPQFINPNPTVVTDVRFRRALLHAIDRQAMADTIQAGLVPVAHSYVGPGEPEFAETERYAVRYEYDVRRAAQMLEELRYTKGADGVYRDADGQRLALEVRATASPAIHAKALFPVVDYWQRLGLAIDPVVIPVQRLNDFEYRNTHPSFEVIRHPKGALNPEKLHSSVTPLPQNRFNGTNRSRYMNPEFDALVDKYVATIPWGPRVEALGQIVFHISDQLNAMGLFYELRTTLVSDRLLNITAQNPPWNIHQWDLKS